MLSDDDKAKLLDLANRAAENPLDYRDLFNSACTKMVRDRLKSLSLELGTLIIAYAYETMPPRWGMYRHLSVSDHGKPVNDALFYEIAQLVGMGDTSTWDHGLMEVITRTVPTHAKHAMQPVPRPTTN